jgi:hypothetical protein
MTAYTLCPLFPVDQIAGNAFNVTRIIFRPIFMFLCSHRFFVCVCVCVCVLVPVPDDALVSIICTHNLWNTIRKRKDFKG